MNRITEKEIYLIKILWEKGESSAKVVYEESLKDRKRSYQTIKTLLDRMVVKEFLDKRKFGPIWLYTPKVSKSFIESRLVKNLVENVLDDKVNPIFTYLIRNKKRIKGEEIKMIKELLNQLEEK